MKESHIESEVNRWAEGNGILHYKLNGPGQRGKPDHLYLFNGTAIFIEFKRPGEVPEALQLRHMKRLREKGFRAEWFYNSAHAIQYLKRHFNLA